MDKSQEVTFSYNYHNGTELERNMARPTSYSSGKIVFDNSPRFSLEQKNKIVTSKNIEEERASMETLSKGKNQTAFPIIDCCIFERFQELRSSGGLPIEPAALEPIQILMYWVDFHRDIGIDRYTRRPCPMQNCDISISKKDGSLQSHLLDCPFLSTRAYMCTYHNTPEIFMSEEELHTHRKNYRRSKFRKFLKELHRKLGMRHMGELCSSDKYLCDSNGSEWEYSSSESARSVQSLNTSVNNSPVHLTSPWSVRPITDPHRFKVQSTCHEFEANVPRPPEDLEPNTRNLCPAYSSLTSTEYEMDGGMMPSELGTRSPRSIRTSIARSCINVSGPLPVRIDVDRQSSIATRNTKVQSNLVPHIGSDSNPHLCSPVSTIYNEEGQHSRSPVSPYSSGHAMEILPDNGVSLDAIVASSEPSVCNDSLSGSARFGSRSPMMLARGIVDVPRLDTKLTGNKGTQDITKDNLKPLTEIPKNIELLTPHINEPTSNQSTTLQSHTQFIHPTWAGQDSQRYSHSHDVGHLSATTYTPSSASSKVSSTFDQRTVNFNSPATATDTSPYTPRYPLPLSTTINGKSEPKHTDRYFPLEISHDYPGLSEGSAMNDASTDQMMTDYPREQYSQENDISEPFDDTLFTDYPSTQFRSDINNSMNIDSTFESNGNNQYNINNPYNAAFNGTSGAEHKQCSGPHSSMHNCGTSCSSDFTDNHPHTNIPGWGQQNLQSQVWQGQWPQYSTTNPLIHSNSSFHHQGQTFQNNVANTTIAPAVLSNQYTESKLPSDPQVPEDAENDKAEGSLPCDMCDFASKGKTKYLKSNLRRHKRERHDPKSKSTRCTVCQKPFKRMSNLITHLKSVHAKKLGGKKAGRLS